KIDFLRFQKQLLPVGWHQCRKKTHYILAGIFRPLEKRYQGARNTDKRVQPGHEMQVRRAFFDDCFYQRFQFTCVVNRHVSRIAFSFGYTRDVHKTRYLLISAIASALSKTSEGIELALMM